MEIEVSEECVIRQRLARFVGGIEGGRRRRRPIRVLAQPRLELLLQVVGDRLDDEEVVQRGIRRASQGKAVLESLRRSSSS